MARFTDPAPQKRATEVVQRRATLHELLDVMLDRYPALETQLRHRLRAALSATEEPESVAASCMQIITRHMSQTIGMLRHSG